MTVTVDTSELDTLVRLMETAMARTIKERGAMLDEAMSQTESEARSILAGYNGTGETAAGLQSARSGVSVARVWTTGRGGFFLEYGSPNTGGPRPWLSGPAERAADRLVVGLAKVGDLWQ